MRDGLFQRNEAAIVRPIVAFKSSDVIKKSIDHGLDNGPIDSEPRTAGILCVEPCVIDASGGAEIERVKVNSIVFIVGGSFRLSTNLASAGWSSRIRLGVSKQI